MTTLYSNRVIEMTTLYSNRACYYDPLSNAVLRKARIFKITYKHTYG